MGEVSPVSTRGGYPRCWPTDMKCGVKLSAGPFAVDDAQPTILRKTQLTTENDTSEKE